MIKRTFILRLDAESLDFLQVLFRVSLRMLTKTNVYLETTRTHLLIYTHPGEPIVVDSGSDFVIEVPLREVMSQKRPSRIEFDGDSIICRFQKTDFKELVTRVTKQSAEESVLNLTEGPQGKVSSPAVHEIHESVRRVGKQN